MSLKKEEPWYSIVRQGTSKVAQNCHKFPFFFFAIYSWAFSLPFKEVCFSCEAPLEETKVSFASGYQFEIVSGLVTEACAHISFKL